MALQLLEAETSKPLAGARLHLFYLLKDGRGKVVKAVTDAKGRLGVDIPQPPYRALNLFVTADGHVPKVTSWGFQRSMPSMYTMKLERGVSIGGVVIDQAGQPVAGAQIEFNGPGNDSSLAENIQFGPDSRSVTDANGQWSCDMIPKDFEKVSLLVTHSQYAETSLTVRPSAPDANRLVITMPAGFSVAGIVQDSSGNPVAGATVRQVRMNQENERTQTSDRSGAFLFRNMAARELMLAVQARGLAPAVQTLQVTGDVSMVRFELGPGQLLSGRVIDEAGNPLANAFVETTRRGLDKITWSTNTDANGRFEWDSAPPEPLLYSILAEGYNRAYAQPLVADGSEHEIKLKRDQPKDAIQIRGTVADAVTGQALDNFKVFVGELDPDWAFPLRFYTSGTDGQFMLSFPSESSHPGYQIQIESAGYLPALSTNFLLKQGNQALEFKLQKGDGPSGVVLLPGGEPAGNATVLLCTPLAGVTLDGPAHVEKGLNTTTYRTQTDGAGRFALAPAIDPQGIIIVHEQGYTEMPPSGLLPGGTVTLQPWGRLEGKLILDSHPVPNQQIVAFNQVARYSDAGRRFGFLTFYLETTTDVDGKFAFNKVPPGQCEVSQRLRSRGSMFSSYEARVNVKSGETTRVVLGGTGRTVVGKAVLSGHGMIDWQTVPVRLRSTTGAEPGPRPQHQNYSSVQEFIAASENFFQAYRGQQHFGAFCCSDGSFRLADVPAGSYELKIELRNFMLDSVTPHDRPDPAPVIAALTRQVDVPQDQNAESLDLGVLELAPQQTNAAAAMAH
jgi:protocatechuate 3,4-dioxygenase beta subunit